MMTTVDFYKEKIQEMKQEFDEEMFQEKRPHDEIEEDGEVWKRFKNVTRQESMSDALNLEKAAT